MNTGGSSDGPLSDHLIARSSDRDEGMPRLIPSLRKAFAREQPGPVLRCSCLVSAGAAAAPGSAPAVAASSLAPHLRFAFGRLPLRPLTRMSVHRQFAGFSAIYCAMRPYSPPWRRMARSWNPSCQIDPRRPMAALMRVVVTDLNAAMMAPNDPGAGPFGLAGRSSNAPVASTPRVDTPGARPTGGSNTRIACR